MKERSLKLFNDTLYEDIAKKVVETTGNENFLEAPVIIGTKVKTGKDLMDFFVDQAKTVFSATWDIRGQVASLEKLALLKKSIEWLEANAPKEIAKGFKEEFALELLKCLLSVGELPSQKG